MVFFFSPGRLRKCKNASLLFFFFAQALNEIPQALVVVRYFSNAWPAEVTLTDRPPPVDTHAIGRVVLETNINVVAYR